MRVYNIIESSTTNGPYITGRTTFWFSGCTVGCIGCINPHLWDKNPVGTKEMSPSDLVNIIRRCKQKFNVDGVTLSGGEPLEQGQELLEFLRLIKEAALGIDVMVYTGRLISDIKDYSILNYIDILVDGPYVASKQNYDLTWRGSENQRIFLLNDQIREKMKNFYNILDENGNIIEEATGLEVILKPNGEVETTGFGPITERSLKKLL